MTERQIVNRAIEIHCETGVSIEVALAMVREENRDRQIARSLFSFGVVLVIMFVLFLLPFALAHSLGLL